MVGLSARLAATVTIACAAHPPEFSSARAWRSTPAGKPASGIGVVPHPRCSRLFDRDHDAWPSTSAFPTPARYGAHGQYRRHASSGLAACHCLSCRCPLAPCRCAAGVSPGHNDTSGHYVLGIKRLSSVLYCLYLPTTLCTGILRISASPRGCRCTSYAGLAGVLGRVANCLYRISPLLYCPSPVVTEHHHSGVHVCFARGYLRRWCCPNRTSAITPSHRRGIRPYGDISHRRHPLWYLELTCSDNRRHHCLRDGRRRCPREDRPLARCLPRLADECGFSRTLRLCCDNDPPFRRHYFVGRQAVAAHTGTSPYRLNN